MVGSEDFEKLPASLAATLDELTAVLDSVGPESPMQGRLEQTLLELDRTLRQVQGLASTLERQPNAILFDKAVTPDPEPRGER